jgi:hypothetical protein
MDTRSSDTTSASGSQFAEGHSLAPNHTCCYIHMVCSSWLLPPKPHPNHTRTLTIPDAHPNHLQTMCEPFANHVPTIWEPGSETNEEHEVCSGQTCVYLFILYPWHVHPPHLLLVPCPPGHMACPEP